ncbi:hypothetical protein PSH03_003825 [Micromonospora sp. PSH03]|uniref:hypothetical protein n=1 Tax=Micromonospora salmantinae TaxID=2911211 RepID=UPI001EE8ABAB|nr:hypothetical protein [Micromonospora salmantinae]MCG5454663.1 hypothetical protein [Micromonospora salmantinae]
MPGRAARQVKDQVTRRALDRFAENAINVASVTQSITIHPPQPLETVTAVAADGQ